MTTTTRTTARPSKALHITLWILQALLAAAFLMTGLMKLAQPITQLAGMLPWVTEVPALLVRFIGLAEVAGALGLILPALTPIRPNLTPLAALGLVAVMLLASAFYLTRGEGMMVPMNLVLAALASFAAWGRTRKAPIQAR
ncbi:DoxX family protein [Deinococcus peraridilitoris]|uniref:DoxX protein n=1 Tax=Deinococcus peraridilitoris (strain DSM 19664 / LMG 22246 / CIP 109416 / KR-200) TaxID=937777 RepID=L0A505_DEIPD|nr:DoxX family protein [Deinococcus peraridilitoris]AFZ68946.1 DoxX protein [Deinococcus peraridilitoris DSM 19664]